MIVHRFCGCLLSQPTITNFTSCLGQSIGAQAAAKGLIESLVKWAWFTVFFLPAHVVLILGFHLHFVYDFLPHKPLLIPI
jgi:hypothetical protein